VEYFLPQWHAVMTYGQPGGVMCSTNRVNGVDACMNPTYLQGFLRERFNFTGYVVTDGTVRVFREKFTLEGAIGSHTCHSSRVSTFLTS
jgi:hypothetical protein